MFTVLALAVSGSGDILSGGYGVQDFSRATVSLVQLVLLLVPLTALLLGFSLTTGETELLYSQHASRAAILLDRWPARSRRSSPRNSSNSAPPG